MYVSVCKYICNIIWYLDKVFYKHECPYIENICMCNLQFRFPVRVPSRVKLHVLGMGMKNKDSINSG